MINTGMFTINNSFIIIPHIYSAMYTLLSTSCYTYIVITLQLYLVA